MKRIKVSLARRSDRSYEIIIGRDILERACMLVSQRGCSRRMVVIADSNVAGLHGEACVALMCRLGMPAELITFPAGEASKTIDMVLSVSTELLERKVDRSATLVALGGGVTGDLVGFVASIYMRSIPFIQIPTSLIAQVDSSIGGKTGVDFKGGKNLLGSFYQPKDVIIDISWLDTLPEKEFKNGLAEVVKYGIIDDADLFETLEWEASALLERSPGILERVVERCCAIKKGLVEIDEYDLGIRRILNFGHTIGHALEGVSDYRINHGTAVSIGMVAEARIAEKKGCLDRRERERIEALLDSLGLERTIPVDMDTNELLSRIGLDKKRRGGKVPFVLIKKIGVSFINGSVDENLVKETIEELKV